MAADDKVDVISKKETKEKDKKKEKKEKSDKKDKKDKKEKDKDKKRSDTEGVHKDKKDKKKDKKDKEKLARALEAHLAAKKNEETALVHKTDSDDESEETVQIAGNLVPFALPLADAKTHKKIYKLIKKGAKLKAISRGVKECEKTIKKCPPKPVSAGQTEAPGVVVIAGDISPIDVITHFPILCEEHGVPYVFVKSRAELGMAACTKRATSVVMLKTECKKLASDNKTDKKPEEDAEDLKATQAEYLDGLKELVKIAQKEWEVQVQPWVKGIHPLQIEEKQKQSGMS